MNFEEVADTVDEEDSDIGGSEAEELNEYKRNGKTLLGCMWY